MSLIDRLVWTAVILVVGAVALPVAVPALVTAAIVGTCCFVTIRLVVYYTKRW